MTAYQADTVFLPVIPSFEGFGAAMTRGTQQAATQAGKVAGRQFSSAANKGATTQHGNGLADYFFSPALNAAAARGGGGAGRAFATGISRALVGSVTTRIGTALGDALSAKVSSKLSQSTLFSGFAKNAQKAGAVAGTAAGQQVTANAQKAASRVNWSVLNNRKLAVVAVGAGVLFGRHLASSAEKQARASFHPESLFSPLRLGALGAASAIAGVIGGALAKGGQRLEAIDDARGKLDGLGHSAKTVDKIMDDALASVKGTAFGLDEAATVSASAVAAGIKPGKELQGTLKLVADAATIGGSSLTDMGSIFGKVASSNKVYNDTLNQLGDQGIPIVELLGKKMHKSSDEVRDLASKGKIDFKTFKGALQDGLGGAALASGDTFRGALKNVGAAYGRFGADLLKGAFPQLKGVLGDVTKTLDGAGPVATRIGKKIGSVFADVVGLVKAASPLFGTFGRLAAEAFRPFGKSLGTGQGALKSLTDFVSTHQSDITHFFVSGGHAAILFGKGVAAVVSGALKAYAGLSDGVGAVMDFLLRRTQIVVQNLAGFFDAIPGMDKAAAAAHRAADGLQAMRDQAARDDGGSAKARALAASIDGKLVPALDRADRGLKKVGNAEVTKAKQRDEARALALAVDAIGTRANGSQLHLKRFSDISKFASGEQKALRSRINDARTALGQQLSAARDAGEGQKKLTQTWETGRKRLYDEFKQMGLSKKEAQRLADKYAGIKPKVETRVTQPGMKTAKSDTDKLHDKMNNLPNPKVKITYSSNAEKFAKSFKLGLTLNSGEHDSAISRKTGGMLPGYTPGRDVHRFVSPTGGVLDLSGGEPVMRPEFGRVVGKGWVDAANAAARSGGVNGVRQFLGGGRQAYATGGVYRNITTNVTTPGLGLPDFGSLTTRIARALGDKLGAAIGAKLDKAGGGNTGKALSYARAHVGHPYQFGTLWDCSGFISALHSIAKNEQPHRRYVTTSFVGGSANGFTRGKHSGFMVGVNPKPGKSGHMAGTINGVNVESAGGVGVRVGKSARGYNSPMFSWRGGLASGGFVGDLPYDLVDPHGERYNPRLRRAVQATPTLRTQLFDSGGILQPGLTLAINGTGRPERIRTEVQERQLTGATTSRVTEHHYHGPDAGDLIRRMTQQQQVNEVMEQYSGGGGF